MLFRHHVCLSNLKHAPSRKLPLTAHKTVFSHLKLSACWLSRNIFYTTIIQQNIDVLSSECKWYLLKRLCIKRFNNSNYRFCVRRVTFSKQGLSRINLSRTFFFQLFTVIFKRLLSGVIVVGSCLLLRSSTASQCKSSSTLVLLTALSR